MADIKQRDSKGYFLPGNTISKGKPKHDLTDMLERFGNLLDENYSTADRPVTKAEAIVLRLLDELSDTRKKLSPQLIAIFFDRYFGPITQTHLSADLGKLEDSELFQQFLEFRKIKQLPDSTE